MKTNLKLLLSLLFVLLLPAVALAGAGGAAFNYQGQIFDGDDQPINDLCDFAFGLYDSADSQTELATWHVDEVPVTDGLFSLSVDFGAEVFDGAARWLGTSVRCGDEQEFDSLSRQPILAVPYAVYAQSVDWAHVTGRPEYSAGAGLALTGTEFSLPGSYQLPQNCDINEGPEWTGSGWVCAPAGSVDYSAGSGLTLTGTEFSIPDSYQLPQNCAANETPKWTGNSWVCALDSNTDTLATLSCDIGQVARWDGDSWRCQEMNDAYSKDEINGLLATKADIFHTHTTVATATVALAVDWDGIVGLPAGFVDNTDDINDTVSWSEISSIVGAGATHVASGNHDHDSDYYTQSQVDEALALKLAATDTYTVAQIDAALDDKLDTIDFTWSGLSGVPAGLVDGVDNIDDTVSWSEISGLVGTGATNVAPGNHDHDSDYTTQSQVDEVLALKLDATDAYTTAEIDSQIDALQADIDTKVDASQVYTTAEMDAALDGKLDTIDFTWNSLAGIPAGLVDGVDNTDDTVSWSEISGLVGTGATNVAAGNHDHDGDYTTQSQVDEALTLKLDATDAYTTAEIDSQLAAIHTDLEAKIDAAQVYTTAEIDSQIDGLQADIDAKIEATAVYTIQQSDDALARKLDVADHTWNSLAGIPADFVDGVDQTDDTVSWSEISGLVGTSATNVALGNHDHDGDYYTQSQLDEALVLKLDATDAYTTVEIDSQIEALESDLALKLNATDAYTTAEIDAALAFKLDAADHTWSRLAGIPAGFSDGLDNTDDAVSWSEISELVGTNATNVAPGNHDHNSDYYTQSQLDDALALKLDATDAYTTAEIESRIDDLQAEIDTKVDASQVYTTAELDDALAGKLDTASFTWGELPGIPVGFTDGVDNTDDTVSWSEISGIVGTGSTNVAPGSHTHTYADPTNGAGVYLDYKPNNTACAANQVLKWDAANARWLCGMDSDAGGDITGVTAGSGLTGGGASGAVTLNSDFGGTGSATTVAHSDHTHDASYYTQSQINTALALKLDAADHTWSGLSGIPAGFSDGVDNTDDTVSWSEISGLVGTGSTKVAQGSHTHTYADPTNGAGVYWGYKPNNTACAANQVLKWDATNSRWICGTDSVNTGDITGVTAGSGLTGGGTSGAVTLNVNFAGSGNAATVARSDHTHADSGGWSLSGNSIASGNFIGTTNDQPLVLKTNNQTGLQLKSYTDYFTPPSLIGGWAGNYASNGGVIAGGGIPDFSGNVATGLVSFVGAGSSNSATGSHSVVSGGSGNLAGHQYAVVSGGYNSNAMGQYSVVPGGFNNSAGGNYSFAGGNNATASYQGSFVWSDSTAPTSANAFNSVTFGASGGYRLFTNSGRTSGAQLAAGGGSWSSMSDRKMKENLTPVDTQAVLEQVGELPLSTWNYISQEDEIRHIGPMAQDFYAAFGVGENDTTITAIDGDGVSLAAIQALYERLLALEAENEMLQARLDDLERR